MSRVMSERSKAELGDDIDDDLIAAPSTRFISIQRNKNVRRRSSGNLSTAIGGANVKGLIAQSSAEAEGESPLHVHSSDASHSPTATGRDSDYDEIFGNSTGSSSSHVGHNAL